METILKCPDCKSPLKVVKEPKGTKKDGKPTKREVNKLVCEKCGKRL